eukprot:GILJ01001086.1.p1 GENE.GILJ01001086.1~~GILJ01001086.1.p1  ORF type:complete len:283 (-),score=16.33 GILJ01001086.1:169-1017(-)
MSVALPKGTVSLAASDFHGNGSGSGSHQDKTATPLNVPILTVPIPSAPQLTDRRKTATREETSKIRARAELANIEFQQGLYELLNTLSEIKREHRSFEEYSTLTQDVLERKHKRVKHAERNPHVSHTGPWRQSDAATRLFDNVSPLKPVMLTSWQRSRLNMADRSWRRNDSSPPFKSATPCGRDFGTVPLHTFPPAMRPVIQQRQELARQLRQDKRESKVWTPHSDPGLPRWRAFSSTGSLFAQEAHLRPPTAMERKRGERAQHPDRTFQSSQSTRRCNSNY